MGEYEDWVNKVREVRPDLAKEFDRFSNKEMRKRMPYVIQVEKERDALQAEIEYLKMVPVRNAALESVGVDLKALSLAEQEVLDRQRPDEYDEDWAREMILKYHLPVRSS